MHRSKLRFYIAKCLLLILSTSVINRKLRGRVIDPPYFPISISDVRLQKKKKKRKYIFFETVRPILNAISTNSSAFTRGSIYRPVMQNSKPLPGEILTTAAQLISRAFHAGIDPDPVMCQTVNTTLTNNCGWASCGEWCLTRTTGFCPQIHATVRRNGTDIIFENCTKFNSISCPQVSLSDFSFFIP